MDGAYQPTGKPFNDPYHYVDWLLTVPLLTAELVAVLSLPRDRSVSLTWCLAGAATLMIILGYPSEVAGRVTERALWGFFSTIPFVYILFVLFRELGTTIERQPPQAQVIVRNIRLLLFATWEFYSIVYLLLIVGVSLLSPEAVLSVQVGYSIADVAAKCGYSLIIYVISRAS